MVLFSHGLKKHRPKMTNVHWHDNDQQMKRYQEMFAPSWVQRNRNFQVLAHGLINALLAIN